jgi:WD40 repeat protein
MSFHPSLPQMMAGLRGGTVAVWNLEQGGELPRFRLPGSPFRLRYSPDGERFVAVYGGEAGMLMSVYSSTGNVSTVSRVLTNGASAIDWHPNGRWIAVGGDDGSVNLIDSRTGESRTLGHHKAKAASVAFSPNGAYLVSGGWEKECICWNLQTMRRAFTMALGGYELAFRADGRQCGLLKRPDIRVQLHAFERPINHREFAEDLGTRLQHAAFSPDGRWLAASAGERLGLWDLTVRTPGALASEGAEARLFFTPDSSELYGSCRTDDCVRWQITPATNAETAPQLRRLELQKPAGFTALCLFSNAVAMTGTQGTRLLIPTTPGAERATIDYPSATNWARTHPGINGVSPDGQWLGIFRPYMTSLYVYRLPGLERVAKLNLTASITTFRFSPVSDEVAITSRDHVEFWSTTTWQSTRALTNVSRIFFTPDARTWWLVRDSLNGGLVDARTFEPLFLLPTGTLPLALSPDGRHLAVSVNARRLQLWDLAEVRRQLRDLGLDWPEQEREARLIRTD